MKTYHKRGEKVDGFSVENHPIYMVWKGLKARCLDENLPSYKNYGGRGITVCDRWVHFKNFADDMYPTYKQGLSIERVNNDEGYSPNNCTWANRTEQCLNRRTFKNNTSGFRGVVKKRDGRYIARHDEYGSRYKVGGTFETAEEATEARSKLIALLKTDKDAALALCERPARYDSTTGIRGITTHADGGFLVRVTHKSKRIYLGYFNNLDLAKEALNKWKLENI
jgi:hypothetical protein